MKAAKMSGAFAKVVSGLGNTLCNCDFPLLAQLEHLEKLDERMLASCGHLLLKTGVFMGSNSSLCPD